MTSTTRLTLNMQLPNYATVAYAVQGDSQTRQIVCTLVDGSTPWTPPAGALAVIRYIKPDGTVGLYDTLEGGGAATSTTGNVTTITLAQQMLAVPGDVIVQLNFYTAAGEKLTTFNFRLLVQQEAVTDMTITSSDYFNVLTETIADGIAVAQQLTFPVPIPNGGTGATTGAAARANLELNGRMVANQISDRSSYTLNVPGNARFVVFLTSANSVSRRILIVCATTAGLVQYTDTYTGTSEQMTITTNTNRLSIANNSNSYIFVEILAFGNSPMPTEVTT